MNKKKSKSLILNLEYLLSTYERIKILDETLYSGRVIRVNEIAKKTGVSKGLVSKYLKILAKEKILSRKGHGFLVGNNSKVKSLKMLLNILKIDTKIFTKYKFVKAAGLYGSCAKGTNTELSDVDLWIKVDDVEDKELAKISSELRKGIENLKILVLDNEKLAKLKKFDLLFYHALYFGSIILYGDENEI